MKKRADTISEYGEEGSAQARLMAWGAGLRMIMDNPVTGVGLGAFMAAVPSYSEGKNIVAHNTCIEFAAESGIGAGLCYIFIAVTFITRYTQVRKRCDAAAAPDDVGWVTSLNNASMVSFAGLLVSSLFLSLNHYEVFFYLLIINNTLANKVAVRRKARRTSIGQGGGTEMGMTAERGVPA